MNSVAPGWTVTPKKLEQGVDDEMVERATATMPPRSSQPPKTSPELLCSHPTAYQATSPVRSSKWQAEWKGA